MAAADGEAVRTVVIPTAGRGTRFLPATKAVPKELLPVVDRPAIEYVVEEAADAGLRDLVLVNAADKASIESHFDAAPDLEAALTAAAQHDLLAAVRHSTDLVRVSSVLQHEPRGLGHAVLCAADLVGDQPFLVSLADMIIDGGTELVERMVRARARHGGSVIALSEVPHEQIGKYGCAAVEPTDEPGVVRVTGLVEKPAPEDAPSDLAIVGRYVLDPSVFDVLRATDPGRGGEIQLTDAIATLASSGAPVHAVVFDGRVYDTGDKLEYLKVVTRFATRHPELGPGFRAWLRDFVDGRDGA